VTVLIEHLLIVNPNEKRNGTADFLAVPVHLYIVPAEANFVKMPGRGFLKKEKRRRIAERILPKLLRKERRCDRIHKRYDAGRVRDAGFGEIRRISPNPASASRFFFDIFGKELRL